MTNNENDLDRYSRCSIRFFSKTIETSKIAELLRIESSGATYTTPCDHYWSGVLIIKSARDRPFVDKLDELYRFWANRRDEIEAIKAVGVEIDIFCGVISMSSSSIVFTNVQVERLSRFATKVVFTIPQQFDND